MNRWVELSPRKWKPAKKKLWPWWVSAAGNWWTVRDNAIAVVIEHKRQKDVFYYRIGRIDVAGAKAEWLGNAGARYYDSLLSAKAAALRHLGLSGAARALLGAAEEEQLFVSSDPPPLSSGIVRRLML